MSTLKKIRKELKEKGAKTEDIRVALAMLVCLEALDRLVFPENPATINFSIRKHRFGYPIVYHPNKDTETRYSIYLDGIAGFFQEEKKGGGLYIPMGSKNQFRPIKPTLKELLVHIAAHEVRHRVQHDCFLKKFSPRSANLIRDGLLKLIIEFEGLVFEESRKIYIRENRSKAYIKDRTNRKEFDASVIERLVAKMIHRKNAYSLREEIVSVIKMQAP